MSASESRIKSADDLIVAVEREQLGKPVMQAQEAKPQPEILNQEPAVAEENRADQESPETATEKQEEVSEKPEAETESTAKDEPTSAEDSGVDEYGNTIAKERVYTQDEVNRMIRERLARAKNPEPAPAVEQTAEPAAEGDEDWRTQLHSEIKQVITQEEQTRQHKAWEAKQQAEMAEFEDRFTQGIGRYSDFESIVAGKPITAPMMMATRGMQDPAAFIYAVCKAQPAELDRIAKLPDQYAQIAEMAKLEERMKRPKVVTNAPKPSRKISGDASSEMPKQSIDQLIGQHAHEKIIKTRRLK